jgi:hypothetical protein
MKQTAVEWFANELLYLENEYDMKLINKNEYQAKRKELLKQAKEMEKDQIVDAFSEGTRMIDVNDEMSAMLNGFIYYGETYEQR